MKTRSERQAEAAADSLVQNAINDLNGPRATRFLAPLPVEIVVQITSHLGQRDCLTCMSVCRPWYLTAPQYMQAAWEKIHISPRTLPKNNMRWERCIRDHASSIVLSAGSYSQLCFIIRRLIDCHCRQVISLEVKQAFKISKARARVLLSLLGQVTDQLTLLSFSDLFSSTNVLDTLHAYPNLFQFLYRGISPRWQLQSNIQRPTLPQFTRLTRLFLDFPINMKLQLEPILRNSPNLRYLAYGDHSMPSNILPPSSPHDTISIDDVFSWCPQLVYLQANGGLVAPNQRSISLKLIQQNKNSSSGLRSFMASESDGYGPDQVGPHLLRNANNLVFIGIGCVSDWTTVMRQLHAPRLLMLVLDMLERPNESRTPWNIVLPECPNLIHIDLRGYENARLDLSLLQELKELRQLRLSHLTLRCHRDTFKSLALNGSQISTIKLESVHSVNDMLLEAITHLPTLEELSIAFRSEDDCTDNGLIQFAKQLKRTAIRQLILAFVPHLSPPFLQAVGDLPSLHTFLALGADTPTFISVDVSGVLQMLAATKSLKSSYIAHVRLTGIEGGCATAFNQKVRDYEVKVSHVHLLDDIVSVSIAKGRIKDNRLASLLTM